MWRRLAVVMNYPRAPEAVSLIPIAWAVTDQRFQDSAFLGIQLAAHSVAEEVRARVPFGVCLVISFRQRLTRYVQGKGSTGEYPVVA